MSSEKQEKQIVEYRLDSLDEKIVEVVADVKELKKFAQQADITLSKLTDNQVRLQERLEETKKHLDHKIKGHAAALEHFIDEQKFNQKDVLLWRAVREYWMVFFSIGIFVFMAGIVINDLHVVNRIFGIEMKDK